VRKPEIISYYNTTKGDVDSLDQKCSNHSTGPVAIFYRLLAISDVNVFILYTSYVPNYSIINCVHCQLVSLLVPYRYHRFHKFFDDISNNVFLCRFLKCSIQNFERGSRKFYNFASRSTKAYG
jgi:hypothetical protein